MAATAQKTFTEHERYMHKSGVLLQREGKKIRAFLVRKAVQQLKQAREQLQANHQDQRETLIIAKGADADADADADTNAVAEEKKRKRVEGKKRKLQAQIERLEKEHALLKTLDLNAVVVRAFEQARLVPDREEEEEDGESDRDSYSSGEEGHRQEEAADGYDSEDFEVKQMDEKEDGGGDEKAVAAQEPLPSASPSATTATTTTEQPTSEDAQSSDTVATVEEAEVAKKPSSSPPTDADISNQLVARVLAHKQMQPFLTALTQYVERKEREEAKKQRMKEKKALQRERKEVLIGGRSAAVPTSMFFGSLGDDEYVDGGNGRGGTPGMAGADDDIAEFLGETTAKKKKNRAGQMARRQKAMRQEEARQREEQGGSRFKRRGPVDRDVGLSKYGPSERPKKKKRPTSTDASEATGRSDKRRSESRSRRDRGGPVSSMETGTGAGAASGSARPVGSSVKPHRQPEAAPSHPSWLAKQALKEKEKVAIHAFSGKKITFGDD